jgi:hypothetical protein
LDLYFKNGSKITASDEGQNVRGKRSQVIETLCVACGNFKHGVKMYSFGNGSVCGDCVAKILNFEEINKN